jgi:1-acyl-sn-glycerol-3-phosphate acyltransferase
MRQLHDQTPFPAAMPCVRQIALTWFTRYVKWYLQRHFHGIHLLRLASIEQLDAHPLLVCLNHPSWWDPLIGLYLSQRFFPYRYHVAPIAANSLQKYKFFAHLGFFGVPGDTHQRAFRFLKIGKAVLSRPDGALWVTPQGAFTDVRRPVVMQPGVGHLANQLGSFAMLPLALEYGFWNERLPEAFSCFGIPVIGNGQDYSPSEWETIFSQALQRTIDALSAKVISRDANAFESVLSGYEGTGGIYDLWCTVKAKLRGEPWQPGNQVR